MQLNVLIDASANAVLCDFGLSRMKADVTSRTVRQDGGSIVGSRNWMAPERLLGGSLKKPCDIYALGMTLYEVISNYESAYYGPECLADLHKRNTTECARLFRIRRDGCQAGRATGTAR